MTVPAFTNDHGQEPSVPLEPAGDPPKRWVTFKDRNTGRDQVRKVSQHHPMVERVAREGIDLRRCQAPLQTRGRGADEKGNPTALGPPRVVRCPNPPSVVMVENEPRPDGAIAGMALCDLCSKRVLITHGPGYAKMTPLK